MSGLQRSLASLVQLSNVLYPCYIFMHISCTFETKLGTFRVRHSFVKPGPTAVNLRGALTLTVLVEAIVGRFGQRQLYVRCIKPLKGKTPIQT